MALLECEVRISGSNVNVDFEKELSILSDCQVEYSNSAGSAVKSLAVFGFGLPIRKSEPWKSGQQRRGKLYSPTTQLQ